MLAKLDIEDIKSNDLKLNMCKLAPNVLIAISSQISKPNSPNFAWLAKKIEHKKKTSKLGGNTIVDDLIELLHNDSCWRYSVVGNWFKFVSNTIYNSDSIEFMKELRHTSIKINVGLFN